MTRKDFEQLSRGDIVRAEGSADSLIVCSNYGGRVTAVRTADLTNPAEWRLVFKVDYPAPKGDDMNHADLSFQADAASRRLDDLEQAHERLIETLDEIAQDLKAAVRGEGAPPQCLTIAGRLQELASSWSPRYTTRR